MRIRQAFVEIVWIFLLMIFSLGKSYADSALSLPNFKTYLGMPRDVYSNNPCPPTVPGGDAREYKLISDVADAVFIGTVKARSSNDDGPIFHVHVKASWKGVSPGDNIEMRSSKFDPNWLEAPRVGRTYLVMAAGKPLVWRFCTYSLDVTEMDKKVLANKERTWSKWFGLKQIKK